MVLLYHKDVIATITRFTPLKRVMAAQKRSHLVIIVT